MTKKESSTQNEPKPLEQTTQADEQESEHKAEVSAPLPIVNPPATDAEEPKPTDSYDETDRKQDEAIDSLAEQTKWIIQQTKWMARQTYWTRLQAIFSIILGAVTLGVLVYHGIIMGRQSQTARDQTSIMRGQLESMNSSSKQTQDLIDATRGTANASQSVAEQNKELVAHAGEQAKASLAQAEAAKQSIGAAQTSARASEQVARIAQQSFYIGDRPYVTAKNAVMDKFELGAKPRVSVLFINTGKTPAIDLQMGAIVSVGRAPEPDLDAALKQTPSDLIYPFMPEGSKMLLPAGGETYAEVQGAEVISKATLEEIKSSKIFLFVWGGAFYKDGLGKLHKLQFCLFYDPSSEGFVACPTFNRIN